MRKGLFDRLKFSPYRRSMQEELDNSSYWKSSRISLDDFVNYDVLKMAVGVLPNGGGVVTEQSPDEIYTAIDAEAIKRIPVYGENIHQNLLTSQYVAKVYNEFIVSKEGQAFVDWLKRYGNGRRNNPGQIDKINVVNKGPGLVAATFPQELIARVLINHDYIHQFAMDAERKFGLSYKDGVVVALTHEIHHYDGQSQETFQKSEDHVEFDNDFSIIQFYMDRANKDAKNKDMYLRKTQLLRSRYGGDLRKIMDNYVANNIPQNRNLRFSPLERKVEDNYLKAA